MPTYVYECSSCHKIFEREQRITEDALVDCDLCEAKNSVRRIIQPVGIAFKGSGFHINDYTSKPATPDAPASTPEPPAPATPAPPPAAPSTEA